MSLFDKILQEPSYKWQNQDGTLSIPTKGQLWKEVFSHFNIFKSKKNWISLASLVMILSFLPFLYFFIFKYFTLPLFAVMIVYSMIVMGTHGTVWYHRYCTHKAFKFRNGFFRFLTQNLVIRTLPEEIYCISHHVHHLKSDMPGDPYNSLAGFWYVFLAEFNHQTINKDLSEQDYNKVRKLMAHTGVWTNNFKQYQRWGSLAHPLYVIGMWLLNWSIWITALYFIGGFGLVTALFSSSLLWFILVRIFNFTGHGKGEVKHVDGLDFDRTNLAINQTRPGLFTGEWHNNHHLYPASARAGFLPGQLDPAWMYIYMLYKLGAVTSYHDYKKVFMEKYAREQKAETARVSASPAKF